MADLSMRGVQDEIHERYSMIAADLLGPLLHFLTVARDLLGGDAEKVLIMLVISIRTKQHPDFARFSAEQLSSGELPVLPSLGVNVRSIADSTGIPKETVRRKTAELVAAGLLVREGSDLRYTGEGYAFVGPAREALERLAARTYHTVSQLLRMDAEPAD